MRKLSPKIMIGLIIFLFLGGILYLSQIQKAKNKINASDFVSSVNNKYFTLTPGTKFTYKNNTGGQLERIEVVVTDEVKRVMDINTTVVHDRVWLDNELIEDTKDWYAQDNKGNVWYFGESVDNYDNGLLKDHAGSWQAGVQGAKPGIIMPADPQVGFRYRQEYFKGQAEDWGEIIALDKSVAVPYGSFEKCLQTRDWNALEKSQGEYKYYCPDIGFTVLEESVEDEGEKAELISVSAN